MTGNLAEMRQNYSQASLDESSANPNPFEQFQQWFDEVSQTSIIEANAMVLATVDQHGIPSARTVLLKGFDERGLLFFTNYDSKKGRDLTTNPAVAIVFQWPALERQVRVLGIANRVDESESDDYFNSRPIGSRIGAAASPQSEPVMNRAWLEERFERLTNDPESVVRPANWGGFRVEPSMFEFWQGRPNRLHDRLRYDETLRGWEITRLAP